MFGLIKKRKNKNNLDLFNKESFEKFQQKLYEIPLHTEPELIEKYLNPKGGVFTEKSLAYALFKMLGPSLMI